MYKIEQYDITDGLSPRTPISETFLTSEVVDSEKTLSQQPDYQLLVDHRRTDGTLISGVQLRTDYITRTDELIHKMTDGVTVVDRLTHEETLQKPDVIAFLDKSARPVAWLTKQMWPKFAAIEDEPVPEMPTVTFANIDRLQWVNTLDPMGTGKVDIDKVDQSIIRSLRSIYVEPKDKQDGLTDDIDTAPASLDNKTVLIVDEVRSSGRTLDIAKKFYERAFPTSNVVGTHWMGSVATRGTAVGNADLPVWYKEETDSGRGVGNRDETASQKSKSTTQRLGGWFLSTHFTEPDPASIQLRKELTQLAHDTDVLIVPSMHRDEDDYEKRATQLNGGIDFDDYIRRKREQSL